MNFLKKIILNPRLVVIRLLYNLKRIYFDIFFIFKKKYKFNKIFIAGMPMSATTKVKNMCGLIPGYFTRNTPIPYHIDIKQDITDSAFKYCPRWSYSLFKTHLNPSPENINIIKRNDVKKVVVTYRDLRDVVIARYHRLIKFPKKETEPNFAKYEEMKKSEAINHSIRVVSKDFIKWINGWFKLEKENNNFILFIKFEDLIINPEIEFCKILKFYEIELDKKLIKKIVDNTEGAKDMTTNLNESRILPWAISSNFRSGKIGNWKKEFNAENLSNAKKMLGNSLIQLGYEDDFNWKI